MKPRWKAVVEIVLGLFLLVMTMALVAVHSGDQAPEGLFWLVVGVVNFIGASRLVRDNWRTL